MKYPAEMAVTRPATPGISTSAKTTASSTLSTTAAGPRSRAFVIATWAGYKKAGPLLISTEHRGTADGKPLHIFISDVAVKLTGSDNWMNSAISRALDEAILQVLSEL